MEQHRKNIHTKAPQQKHINSIRNSRSFYHKNSNSTTYRFCCSCKVIAWSILEKYVLCRTAVIWTSVDCYVSSVYLFRCFTCFFCFVSVLNYTKNMSQIYLVMKYEKILSSHRAKFAHSQTNQGIHSLLYKKKNWDEKNEIFGFRAKLHSKKISSFRFISNYVLRKKLFSHKFVPYLHSSLEMRS